MNTLVDIATEAWPAVIESLWVALYAVILANFIVFPLIRTARKLYAWRKK